MSDSSSAAQPEPLPQPDDRLTGSDRRRKTIESLMGTLFEISGDFGEIFDLKELLQTVLQKIIDAVGVEAGSIWLTDGSGRSLNCHVAEGPVAEGVVGMRVPLGRGIVGAVAKSGQRKVVLDTTKDKSFRSDADKRTGFETKSMICVPLAVRGNVIGALQIINKTNSDDGLFEELDADFVAHIAMLAAMQVRTVQLFDAERKARDFGSIMKISQEITRSLDLDRVLLALVNGSGSVLQFERAVVVLQRKGKCEISAVTNDENPVDGSAEAAAYERLAARCLDYGKEVVVEEGADIPEIMKEEVLRLMEERSAKTLFLLPLADQEGVVGVLMMETAKSGAFGTGPREAANILANQATVAIRNAELYGLMPMTNMVSKMREHKRQWLELPNQRKKLFAGIVLAVLLFALLPLWDRTAAGDCEIAPATPAGTVVYSAESGVLDGFAQGIAEGVRIDEGAVIAILRDDDLLSRMAQIESSIGTTRLQAAGDSGTKASRRLARLQLESLETELSFLKEQVERLKLVAPCAGHLKIEDPTEWIGRRLKRGDEFCEVIPMESFRIRIKIPEDDITRVALGQRISFKVKSDPGTTWHAEVEQINKVAETKGEERTFWVTGRVDNAKDDDGGWMLRSGFSGRAKIETGTTNILGYLFGSAWHKIRMWWF